jgi:hypothetical protein
MPGSCAGPGSALRHCTRLPLSCAGMWGPGLGGERRPAHRRSSMPKQGLCAGVQALTARASPPLEVAD